MTAIDNTPINHNFLAPQNFKFSIKKAPNVNFFVQEVNLPSIKQVSAQVGNPFIKYPVPGDHMTYEDLRIKIKVDEEMNNYMEIHNWIKSLGKPDTFDQYKQIEEQPSYTGDGIYSDISLIILSNIKNPMFEIVYKDAFPYFLSELVFDTTLEDIRYLNAQASFKYTSYEISKII